VGYAERTDVGEGVAGAAQRVAWLMAGGGGEGFRDADLRLVLGILAGLQVSQGSQHGLGGIGVAAQRGQPAQVAGEIVDAGQLTGIHSLAELPLGGVPVTEQQQRVDQVRDRK